MGRGRPHHLDDPDFAKLVATMFVAGMTREQMCEELDISDRYTITRWRRDPRVKAHTQKLIEDRILQITRRVDSQIEARLEQANRMTIKELLSIRKEFLGGALRQQTEKADAETTREAIEAIEQNPGLVEELEKLFTSVKDD